MRDRDVSQAMNRLRREASRWNAPAVTQVARSRRDPFRVLVSCILSLRTLDQTTGAASRRLFAVARTPEQLLRIPEVRLRKIIYPVGFYRTKATTLKGIARDIIGRFGGRVPSSLDELLTLKGVGRKTANLVLTLGYRKPGICVDTHVHRITNRWGYVRTKRPDETEAVLRRKLLRRHWLEINDLLVAFGQRICRPISPICSGCPVRRHCSRVGVGLSR